MAPVAPSTTNNGDPKPSDQRLKVIFIKSMVLFSAKEPQIIKTKRASRSKILGANSCLARNPYYCRAQDQTILRLTVTPRANPQPRNLTLILAILLDFINSLFYTLT